MKVLNFGSLNIDKVYQVDHFVQPGETEAAKSYQINCGGKGLNQSIAAAKAGCEVYHAGKLGSDGRILRDALQQNGVNVSYLKDDPGVSGHAIIEVDARGQNCILLYGGANQNLQKEEVCETLDAFHAGDIVLLQNETNLVSYIMEEADRRGLQVVLNAAPMNQAVLSYPLHLLRWLIVNEVEGKQIAQCSGNDDIIPTLHAKYPDISILLTLGKEGAVAFDQNQTVRIGSHDVKAVDTTAAGDTFTGYFLAGLTNHQPLADTLQQAAAASAIAVTRHGAAVSIPTPFEVQDAFASGWLKPLTVRQS